jgi:hypothetical protein
VAGALALAALAVLGVAAYARPAGAARFFGGSLGEEAATPATNPAVSPSFAPLVSTVHTTAARVDQAGAHVAAEEFTTVSPKALTTSDPLNPNPAP